MEEYSYTSTHPLGHTGPVTGSVYPFVFLYYIIKYEKTEEVRFQDFMV